MAKKALLDPASMWSVREVTRFREVDYELELDMQQNSPQALLRDLHRPITSFGVTPSDFPKIERINDGGRRDVADIKLLVFADYRVPIEALVPTREMYRASLIERRSIMKAPWADAPKFGKQYLPGGMASW